MKMILLSRLLLRRSKRWLIYNKKSKMEMEAWKGDNHHKNLKNLKFSMSINGSFVRVHKNTNRKQDFWIVTKKTRFVYKQKNIYGWWQFWPVTFFWKDKIPSLNQYVNTLITSATFRPENIWCFKSLEKSFFSILTKDKTLSALYISFLRLVVRKVIYVEVFKILYVVQREQTKNVLNRYLVLFGQKIIVVYKTNMSKTLYNNIASHIQHNYCTSSLQTLVSVFKVC